MLVVLIIGSVLSVAGQSSRDLGEILANRKCASCHTFTPRSLDWVELAATQGPDLSYSGNKYQDEWLQQWLVTPRRIRPAGYIAFRYIVTSASGDRVQTGLLPQHPAVLRAEAKNLVEYLGSLRRDLNPYPQSHNLSAIRPELHFTKLLPCSGCHRAASQRGGVTGPDLTDTSRRLKREWVMAYLTDPVYWVRDTMPKFSMRADQLAAVTDYLIESRTEQASAPYPEDKQQLPAENPVLRQIPSTRVGVLYQLLCSQCHGITGNGKGVNASFLFVTPRDHTSPEEMNQLTDDRLFAAIKFGGPAVNKSPLMPAWGAILRDSDIQLLVKHLRTLSGVEAAASHHGARNAK